MSAFRQRRGATRLQSAARVRLFFSAALVLTPASWFVANATSAQPNQDQSRTTRSASAPQLVKDINPGDASSTPEMFVTFNGALYFRANDGAHGVELWRTDGTSGGTMLVTDLFPGPSNGVPGNLTVAGGKLYFHGFTEPTGSKVFDSDGTARGTRLLADTFPGAPDGPDGPPLPAGFTTFGANVLFAATDAKLGYELWITDGTPAGTMLLKDIHPGEQWSVPVGITPLGTRALLAADDSFVTNPDGTVTYDRELFVTDGSAAGTRRLVDINPGPLPSIPVDLTLFGDRVLFRADDGVHGAELWTSNGTAEGTRMLVDINQRGSSSPSRPTVAGRRMFFSADDGMRGAEPWLSDGTAAGTRLIFDINPIGASNPGDFTVLDDRVVFAADDGEHGRELWVSDGTEAGTQLVSDINPGAAGSSPLEFATIDGRAYFVAVVDADQTTGTVRTQLWTTDGTSGGTSLVWEAPGRFAGYVVRHLTAFGSQLLFHAPGGVDETGLSTDIELYRLDVSGSITPPRDSPREF
jgi:ELWxxDGT repeat protein